ncbi:hypothetical protein [Micromonospora aurantiaca (nom. illeg.)]|uniref:hypothetical protein n=1 Tax=Micromonospora aurantiaca (nom. illeg.) TaxID=47850 RepID=UPI00114C966E|nr:hypothetical protein [Micromonospora aurantiaca]
MSLLISGQSRRNVNRDKVRSGQAAAEEPEHHLDPEPGGRCHFRTPPPSDSRLEIEAGSLVTGTHIDCSKWMVTLRHDQ